MNKFSIRQYVALLLLATNLVAFNFALADESEELKYSRENYEAVLFEQLGSIREGLKSPSPEIRSKAKNEAVDLYYLLRDKLETLRGLRSTGFNYAGLFMAKLEGELLPALEDIANKNGFSMRAEEGAYLTRRDARSQRLAQELADKLTESTSFFEGLRRAKPEIVSLLSKLSNAQSTTFSSGAIGGSGVVDENANRRRANALRGMDEVYDFIDNFVEKFRRGERPPLLTTDLMESWNRKMKGDPAMTPQYHSHLYSENVGGSVRRYGSKEALQRLLNDINASLEQRNLRPEQIELFAERFLNIHPFEDGNGKIYKAFQELLLRTSVANGRVHDGVLITPGKSQGAGAIYQSYMGNADKRPKLLGMLSDGLSLAKTIDKIVGDGKIQYVEMAGPAAVLRYVEGVGPQAKVKVVVVVREFVVKHAMTNGYGPPEPGQFVVDSNSVRGEPWMEVRLPNGQVVRSDPVNRTPSQKDPVSERRISVDYLTFTLDVTATVNNNGRTEFGSFDLIYSHANGQNIRFPTMGRFAVSGENLPTVSCRKLQAAFNVRM